MAEKGKGRLVCMEGTAAELNMMFAVLPRLRDEDKIPDTTLVISFNRDCITFGRFEDADGIHYDVAKSDGAVIGRRTSGAGTHWGPLGGTGCLLLTTTDVIPNIDEAERIFVGEILLETCKRYGIEAPWYKHPGDLKIGERKIVGTATQIHGKGIMIGSFLNIHTPSTKFFSDYLIYPDEKLKDKTLKDLTKYAASFETDATEVPTPEEFAETLAEVTKERLGIEFVWGELTEEEKEGIEKVVKVLTDEKWVMYPSTSRWQASLSPDLIAAHAKYKTLKLLGASVAIDWNKTIKDILYSGDFLISPWEDWQRIVDFLKEKSLKADDEEGIKSAVKEAFAKYNPDYSGFTIDEFAIPIIDAAKKAIEELERRK